MSRVAGSGSHYRWVLWDANENAALPGECDIEFPSVTSVIGSVLAKHQLVDWAYRQTRESIAGLLVEFEKHEKFDTLDGTGYHDLFEILSDADWIDDWLEENSARPNDVRDEAAERGTEEHKLLEYLTTLEPADARQAAKEYADYDSPFAKGIGAWWLKATPIEARGETKIVSTKHGFSGTVDLIWKRFSKDAPLTITDLKTRRAGLFMYDSDDIQTAGYKIGWNEMHPDTPAVERTVLIAFDNGTAKEYPAKQPEEVFLHLLRVYELMKEVK